MDVGTSAVKTTLETGGEDGILRSKRVGKMENCARNGWRRRRITLETSGEKVRPHSFSSVVSKVGYTCSNKMEMASIVSISDTVRGLTGRRDQPGSENNVIIQFR